MIRDTRLSLALLAALAAGLAPSPARAGEPARLVYAGKKQLRGQSDRDFARSCVRRQLNTLSTADRGWWREQDRIDANYERELYAAFDFIAARRKSPAQAVDLKIAFQEEVRQHWEEYVARMASLLAGVERSTSIVDRALAAEYRASRDRGRLYLQIARRKLADLRAERARLGRKR